MERRDFFVAFFAFYENETLFIKREREASRASNEEHGAVALPFAVITALQMQKELLSLPSTNFIPIFIPSPFAYRYDAQVSFATANDRS